MSADRIRELNDTFRRTFVGGRVTMTAGIAALPDDVKVALFERVKAFDDFKTDNDPHREHDFGALEHARASHLLEDRLLRRGDGVRIGGPGRPITDNPRSHDHAHERVLIIAPPFERGASFPVRLFTAAPMINYRHANVSLFG